VIEAMEEKSNDTPKVTEKLESQEGSNETAFLEADSHTKETLGTAEDRATSDGGSYRDLLRRLSQTSEEVERTSGDFAAVFNVRALVGKTLAKKYEILERVGRGGMGTVFRARDVTLDRYVAVKVLNPSLSDDEHALNRFLREAKLVSRLKHQNAISLYEFGLEGAIPYLVMEYVEGKSLEALITDEGPFDAVRTNIILQQVCSALISAHSLGILHRDLKPDNIMVTRQPDGFEFVQVLDFGMAKALGVENERGPKISSTGVPCGTPHYMAPELITAQDVDLRADIYALGIIAYQMLVGKTPFEDLSTVEILYHQFHTVPPLVTEANPLAKISRGIEKTIAKTLEKEPKHRFQTVEEFAERFNAHIADDFIFVSGSQSARVIEPYRIQPGRSRQLRFFRDPLVRFWFIWFWICVVVIAAIWLTAYAHSGLQRFAAVSLFRVEELVGTRLEGWRALANIEVDGTFVEAASGAKDRQQLGKLLIYITAGRNLDVRDEAGDSLLHMAVLHTNPDAVVRLLQAKVNASPRNKLGVTPLMLAMQSGSTGIAHILLENGAIVDAKDEKGRTALMLASAARSLGGMHALFIYGAGVNLADEAGKSALMYAVEANEAPVVEFLLDRGASVEQKDGQGRTALVWAVAAGAENSVALLLSRSAQVEVLTQGNLTPLMIAISKREFDIAEMLLKQGANPEAANSFGVSAKEMARLQGEEVYDKLFGSSPK
jgi:serine/threonine protein kinase/ankyrin repeat protein